MNLIGLNNLALFLLEKVNKNHFLLKDNGCTVIYAGLIGRIRKLSFKRTTSVISQTNRGRTKIIPQIKSSINSNTNHNIPLSLYEALTIVNFNH
jgi:hypothetical protein